MSLITSQWHLRYLQQARWTQSIRTYLYQKSGIGHAQRILDVGCGTGVLEHEFAQESAAHTFGVDLDLKTLQFAHGFAPAATYTVGDCISLPFSRYTFDITLCHFLLLWVSPAQKAIEEMSRVTRPGGTVLALAEPDYGGRIDFPLELEQIGDWQTDALKKQGANPFVGRQLSSMFSKANLVNIEVGILGGQWRSDEPDSNFELEWQILEADLQDNEAFKRQSEKLKSLERSSRTAHQRILFVPVFYARGMIPD